jgi:hypothetical protein
MEDAMTTTFRKTLKEDSQSVEEGTGRPGRSGWCSPTGGCVIASPIPPRRIIPTEEPTTLEAHPQSPSRRGANRSERTALTDYAT